MGSALLATTSILLAAAGSVVGQFDYAELTNKNSLQTGDGTFYGEGQDDQGTCSFSGNFANTNDLPWTTGVAVTLALNDNQFADGAACGLCVMYRGTGAGLGTTPIPSTWTMGFVNNRCPECSRGDLDQATSGDGRWDVEWYAVPCNVGDSSLVYSIVVSSYYWFSLVVSNTRTPITGVSVEIGGSWLPLKRTNNNQWAYYNTNGPWQSSFPMPIRVTNVLGETVQDTITDKAGNSGTVQFSPSGSGSTSATPTTTGTLPGSTTPPGSAPPTMQTPPAITTPPSPAATLPTGIPPPTLTVPPPAASTPPAPLPAGGFYVEDYQQCGGKGGACNDKAQTSAPCMDNAWANAACKSADFGCTRYDETLWTCVPGTGTPPTTGSPPPTTQPPAPVGGIPPPVLSTPPPQEAVSPPPATPASPPQTAGTSNANLQAAQSLAGVPPPVLTSQPPPSQATQPPPTQATQPPPTETPAPPAPDTSSQSSGSSGHTFTVLAGGQCGGTSQCTPAGEETDKVTCNNGPWSGAVCSDGTTCQADPGPLIWTCKSSPVATGGRRLLSS